MRVTPKVWIGITIWALYTVLVFAVQKAIGIPYDEWGDSAANLWRGAVISLAAGAALMALMATVLGWWRPALFDDGRSTMRWAWAAPIAMLVLLGVNLTATDFGEIGTGFLVAAIVLGIGVGFSEEFMARGLLLVGLRSQLSERWVWILTSVLFGAFHLINILLGAPVTQTVIQVVTASLSGCIFYVTRRLTGSLFMAMVLHGAWDFSTFVQGHAPAFAPPASLIVIVGIVAAVAAWRMTAPGRDDVPAPAAGRARDA
ncbi:CPBP family intramembrane glutamic endopeptidase [Gordonia sp. VNK1]|uniref:CPBP family intramembrane glutamic endopeptidase n=1 Tax=Gordonia oleivorans TaxID=3156618 RepID=UPI0032B5A1D7